jgi:cytidylate kinase
MLVTVSGPPGAGKSTTAARIAEELGLEHVSGGDIFREMAAERDMTPLEFNQLAEEDDRIDRDLDRRLAELARERDGLVLESRLAGWLAGEHADLKLWLSAPLSVRAARIAEREDRPVEEARATTAAREDSEARRYREYYGVDVEDLSVYDLSLNTARWDADAVLEVVRTAVDAYDPAGDEGKTPVEMDADFAAPPETAGSDREP